MKNKKLLFLVSLITLFGLLFGLASCVDKTNNEKKNEYKNVVTTAWFSYDIAKQLSGDKFNVEMAFPYDQSIHHLEPTAEVYARINDADLLISTSNLMDATLFGPHADKSKLISQDKTLFLFRELFPNEEDTFEHGHSHEHENGHIHEHHHNHDTDHNHSHSSTVLKPDADMDKEHDDLDEIIEHSRFHYWTSLENLKKVTDLIAKRLIQLDESQKDLVTNNQYSLISNIDKISNEFKEFLKGKTLKPIHYVGHDSVGAFMLDFGLGKYYEPFDLNIDDNNEATAKLTAEFVEDVRDSKVKYIFQPEMGEKANEVKAILSELNKNVDEKDKVISLELHGMHNISKEIFEHKTFLDIVKQNIENIKKLIN